MQDPFIGCIFHFAGNFAPRGFMLCQGQLLAISSNTALFSILGTTYGGNGQTNFALPDLRGRTAIGAGQGPGLSNIDLGQVAGTETAGLGSFAAVQSPRLTVMTFSMPVCSMISAKVAVTPEKMMMALAPASVSW